MTSLTPELQAAKRAFNFNAGPGALPLPVLERIGEELLDYRGTGMSVMEMSHRSPEYEEIQSRAERLCGSRLAIGDEYAVLFLQGGGSMQFTMVPMNLCLPGKPVDVLHTGMWTAKAIVELKKGVPYRLAATTEPERFTRVPRADEITCDSNASYVYIASNNTIEGTQWTRLPATGDVPLAADMSSDIAFAAGGRGAFRSDFCRRAEESGAGGVTVVIVRRDLAERADKNLPTILQYRTHIKERSLYHTPPTFAVYAVGLVLEWIEAEGGVVEIETRNEAKAKLLYGAIDGSGFYACPVEKASRSQDERSFSRGRVETKRWRSNSRRKRLTEGLVGLAGHRSVGGMRASLYNAVTLDAVQVLVSFMSEFERTRG